MANSIAVDQVTLAKVADGGDIPEELVEEIHAASADATQALSDASDASDAASAAATAAEDAAKTATSFITTDENGVFFHSEDNQDSSIRIDGDSIDIYNGEIPIISFGSISEGGKRYSNIKTSGASNIEMRANPTTDYQTRLTLMGSDDYYEGKVRSVFQQTKSEERTSSSRVYSDTRYAGFVSESEYNAGTGTMYRSNIDSHICSAGDYPTTSMIFKTGKESVAGNKYADIIAKYDGETDATEINLDADSVKVNSHDITHIGKTITIYGSTSTNVTNKTTATNVLAGRCAVETGTGDGDVFTADTTAGTIEVKKDGVYLIKSSSYHTTNYTSGDIIHNHINIVGKTDFGYERNVKRVTNGSAYDVLQATAIKVLSAGDKIQQQVYNQTSARGYVVTNGTTALQVVKIG